MVNCYERVNKKVGAIMIDAQPSIGDLYSTRSGEEVEVIGFGTGGIVVEYADGRAELLDTSAWQQLLHSATHGRSAEPAS